MFKMRASRFWKCLNKTWNSPEQPVESTQKLAKDKKNPRSWYFYFVNVGGHCYGVNI